MGEFQKHESRAAVMKCYWCGMPHQGAVCPLCGNRNQPEEYLHRSELLQNRPYLLTLVFSAHGDPDATNLEALLPTARAHARCNTGSRQQLYLLYSLDQAKSLLHAVGVLQGTGKWHVLFNGKPYPYSPELWLPMMQFFGGE